MTENTKNLRALELFTGYTIFQFRSKRNRHFATSSPDGEHDQDEGFVYYFVERKLLRTKEQRFLTTRQQCFFSITKAD